MGCANGAHPPTWKLIIFHRGAPQLWGTKNFFAVFLNRGTRTVAPGGWGGLWVRPLFDMQKTVSLFVRFRSP